MWQFENLKMGGIIGMLDIIKFSNHQIFKLQVFKSSNFQIIINEYSSSTTR